MSLEQVGALGPSAPSPPPPPSSYLADTPHPVLIGHAASLTPY